MQNYAQRNALAGEFKGVLSPSSAIKTADFTMWKFFIELIKSNVQGVDWVALLALTQSEISILINKLVEVRFNENTIMRHLIKHQKKLSRRT